MDNDPPPRANYGLERDDREVEDDRNDHEVLRPDDYNHNDDDEEDETLTMDGVVDEQAVTPAAATAAATNTARNPIECLVDWCKTLLPQHHQSQSTTDQTHSSRSNSSSSLTSTGNATSNATPNSVVVTLHYDDNAHCCVAVLSSSPQHLLSQQQSESQREDVTLCSPCALLASYLIQRVHQGTARQRSVLYYELLGSYIRSEYTALLRATMTTANTNSTTSSQHEETLAVSIHVAVGALPASDRAQLVELQAQRRHKRRQYHQATIQHDDHDPTMQDEETGSDDAHSSSQAQNDYNYWLLGQALDICSQRGSPDENDRCLADDLNLVDIYHLASASRLTRRVAYRAVTYQRARLWQFSVIPFCDGAAVGGTSRLTRWFNRWDDGNNNLPPVDNDPPLVTHLEAGGAVAYRQCPAVPLLQQQKQDGSAQTETDGIYVPSPQEEKLSSFRWECEEIALTNLHHWWGDFPFHYVGQKVVVQWSTRYNNKDCDGVGTTASTHVVLVDTIRLETTPRLGKRTWTTSKTQLQLDVVHSETRAIDPVTMCYKGEARVLAVNVPLLTLVRLQAKTELVRLRDLYTQIQLARPLMPHEVDYAEHLHMLVNERTNLPSTL